MNVDIGLWTLYNYTSQFGLDCLTMKTLTFSTVLRRSLSQQLYDVTSLEGVTLQIDGYQARSSEAAQSELYSYRNQNNSGQKL